MTAKRPSSASPWNNCLFLCPVHAVLGGHHWINCIWNVVDLTCSRVKDWLSSYAKGQNKSTTNTLATKQSSSDLIPWLLSLNNVTCLEFCSPYQVWFLTDSLHFYRKDNRIRPQEQRPSAFARTQLSLKTNGKRGLLLRKMLLHIKFFADHFTESRTAYSSPWSSNAKLKILGEGNSDLFNRAPDNVKVCFLFNDRVILTTMYNSCN